MRTKLDRHHPNARHAGGSDEILVLGGNREAPAQGQIKIDVRLRETTVLNLPVQRSD